jgi:hypothetical protein
MALLGRRAALSGISAAIVSRRFRLFAQSPTQYSARAIRLIEECPVVDLLNQFRFPDFAEKPPKIDRWRDHPETFTNADSEPYLNSGINVFALGAGLPITNRGFASSLSGTVSLRLIRT